MTHTHALVRVEPFTVIELYSGLPYRVLHSEAGLDVHLPRVGDVQGTPGYRLCTVSEAGERPSRFHHRIGQAFSLGGNVLTVMPEWEADALDDVKLVLKAEVDAAAGNARSKYITVAAGQDMTYREKVDEARAYQTAADPKNPADYPILMAEVGATAPTIDGVVEVVLGEYASWKNVGAQIEGLRMHGKKAVDGATDIVTAIACVEALEWP